MRWLFALMLAGCAAQVEEPAAQTQESLGACVPPNWHGTGCFDFQRACIPGWECDTTLRHLCRMSDGTFWENDTFAATIASHFTSLPETEYGWTYHEPCMVLCELSLPDNVVISAAPYPARPSCR